MSLHAGSTCWIMGIPKAKVFACPGGRFGDDVLPLHERRDRLLLDSGGIAVSFFSKACKSSSESLNLEKPPAFFHHILKFPLFQQLLLSVYQNPLH